MALTILGLMPDAANYDVRILASDIDPNVVAFGRAGDLRRRRAPAGSGRAAPTLVLAHAGGNSVSDEMRTIVSFRELNLIGDWPMKGGFQAIFCRNVTIYFDEPTRQKIWGRFMKYLEPSGFLYIGHSSA